MEVTLDQFYDAVVADIREAFPEFATVEFDREDRKDISLPAVLLEITEFEDNAPGDPQTEQWAAMARIEANVIFGFRTPALKLKIRKAATALALWLRYRRFKHPDQPGKALPTGPALVGGCYKDDFEPELDQFEVWRVEWNQELTLGASVWDENGTTPTDPLVGFSPNIGIGHEADYVPLDPALGLQP